MLGFYRQKPVFAAPWQKPGYNRLLPAQTGKYGRNPNDIISQTHTTGHWLLFGRDINSLSWITFPLEMEGLEKLRWRIIQNYFHSEIIWELPEPPSLFFSRPMKLVSEIQLDWTANYIIPRHGGLMVSYHLAETHLSDITLVMPRLYCAYLARKSSSKLHFSQSTKQAF